MSVYNYLFLSLQLVLGGNILLRQKRMWRRGLASGVGALVSGSSGPVSSLGRGHCVVFFGKTLYSNSASLHRVYKWVPAKSMLGVSLR